MKPESRHSAIILGLAAFFVLSVMDALIKGLAETYSPAAVSFGRFGAASLVSLVIWGLAGRPTITLTHIKSHGIRGVLQAISMVLFSISLINLRLMEAMTIAFLAPLLIPILAAVLLKEKLQARQSIGSIIGFVGAITIVAGAHATPIEGGRVWLGVATAVGAAFTYALSIVMLKSRADSDGPVVAGLFSAIVPALVLAPSLVIWGTQAQDIAPLEYSAAIWAGIIGWLAFSETPNALAIIGCLIIIAGGLWMHSRQKKEPIKSNVT
jgi:S-adenosylmethionine uptake transporter